MTRDAPRTVIITGGSSGLGRGTARVFATRGWRVGLIARSEAGLAAAAEDVRGCGGQAATAAADVADSAALAEAADRIVAAIGLPDVWINCAGNGVYGRFGDVPQAEYDRVTAVTYGGTVNGCRVALALMGRTGQGTVVNVCSAVAFYGLPLMTSYAGAKCAVRGFAQALRAELRMAGSALRVSTVFPPAVNTPFFSHAVSHMGFPARPAKPVYQPEVIAAGIYLAATTAQPELIISGTALLFSFITRISPAFTGLLMSRLGFDGQLTRDPEAARLVEPTLFAPSAEPAPVRGPFGDAARGTSVQLWLRGALSRTGRRTRAAALRLTGRPASP